MKEIKNIIGKKFLEKSKNDKKVIAIILFGSFLAQKNYNDIDICLMMDKKYNNEFMFEKRKEYCVITKNSIDVQIFQQLPLFLRIDILKNGKILFCKDMQLIYDIALATIKEFSFFKKSYEEYITRKLI